MSSSRPFSIVWRKSENQLSSRYCVTMPGRGCTKTPPKPFVFEVGHRFVDPFGRHDLVPDEERRRAVLLGRCRELRAQALGNLPQPEDCARPAQRRRRSTAPKRGHIALRNVRFIGCITSQINSWFVLSAVYEFSAGRRHRPSAEKSVVRICGINTRGSAPSPC